MTLPLRLTLVPSILGGISHSGNQERCSRTEHPENRDWTGTAAQSKMRWSNATLCCIPSEDAHTLTEIIHTSSTSSQFTPSPVNPSGQGAHWKPPDWERIHMFCLKQVPGGHRFGWSGMTKFAGVGTTYLLFGRPLMLSGAHGQRQRLKVTLVSKYCGWVDCSCLLLTTVQTLRDGIPQIMCLLNLKHKDTDCKTVNKLCCSGICVIALQLIQRGKSGLKLSISSKNVSEAWYAFKCVSAEISWCCAFPYMRDSPGVSDNA